MVCAAEVSHLWELLQAQHEFLNEQKAERLRV